MNCTSCGGTIEVSSAAPVGRCAICQRLFAVDGGEAKELGIEPPKGAPKFEFRAVFAAKAGLPPAPLPARGMRYFEFLQMDDDARALEDRAKRTAEYEVRAFDIVRTVYRCPRCNTPTPPPPPLVLSRASYRSLEELTGGVLGLVEAGARTGRKIPPCPSCGSAPVLAQADQHSFSSLAKRDLVVRVAPGAAPVLLDWSPATGYQPAAASAELDRAIAADAIVRTLGALRDDFEEHEDIESFLAVMAEGVARAPGTPDLLRFAPFLMKHDGADVVRTIADAHIQAAPRSAVGYYWKAQLLVEAAASGGGNARINEAAALLQQAVTLQPDYPDAQGALANVARLQGDEAKAEQTLRAILQNHPKHPEANYTLGLVLLAKNPAEALACFELGEQGAPNDPDYPRSKARALLALKRIPEARVALQRARSLSPDDPRIEQVAAQLAGQNPVASAMKWIIRLVVLALLAGVGLYVYKLVSAAKPPAAATPAAPAKQKPKTK